MLVLGVAGEDLLVQVVDEPSLRIVVEHRVGESARGDLAFHLRIPVSILGVGAQPVAEHPVPLGLTRAR